MKDDKPTLLYKPSKTAVTILCHLQNGADTWTKLKELVKKSDAGLAKALKLLQLSGAVVRSACEADCKLKHDHREGLYQITEVGLQMLTRADFGYSVSSEKLRAHQRKIFLGIWRKVLRVHQEVLEKMPVLALNEQGKAMIYDFPTPKKDQIVFVAPVVFDVKGEGSKEGLLLKYVDPHEFFMEKPTPQSPVGRVTLTKRVE